jgi:hypothetical protein
LIANTKYIIQGNYVQTANGSLVLDITSDTSITSTYLFVGGCLELAGQVIVLSNNPISGPTSIIPAISFLSSCTKKREENDFSLEEQPHKRQILSPDQLKLVLNYENSQCDDYSISTKETTGNPNMIYIILQYNGNICQTSPSTSPSTPDNKSLIIGLSVGLGGGFIVLSIVIIVVIILRRKSGPDTQIKKEFIDNPSFKNANPSDIEMN